MNDLTTERALEAVAGRICFVCHEPVVELKKAAYVPVGAGLRLTGHASCIQGLMEAHEEAKQTERTRWEAADMVQQLAREVQQNGNF